MSTAPKEQSQFHRWQLDEGVWAELRIDGAMTEARIKKLRAYLDLATADADAPYEGPSESGGPR